MPRPNRRIGLAVDTGGWDTISVLDIHVVNAQLASRLGDVVMSFDTSWTDAFSGSVTADGRFGPWQITGGSISDIYLTLPIASGTATPQGSSGSTDLSGMSVTLEVNLTWIPSEVTPEGQSLQFDLTEVTQQGVDRTPGGVYVKSVNDPHDTGYGSHLADAIANVLVDNKDKVTFVFAQTGIVDSSTATWLQPKRSAYSYHAPLGQQYPVGGDGDQAPTRAYLAVLSVTSDRDISGLNSQLEDGLISTEHPLTFVVSPRAFPGQRDPACAAGRVHPCQREQLHLHRHCHRPLRHVEQPGPGPGGGDLVHAHDHRAEPDHRLRRAENQASGSVYLDLPNAYVYFSSTTSNVLVFDPVGATFTFQKDPSPVTSSSDDVPWYDYILSLTAIGALVTAIVVACVESGLADSLSGSALAGSLAGAPATTVRWAGLDQITVASGALNDCFILQADVG